MLSETHSGLEVYFICSSDGLDIARFQFKFLFEFFQFFFFEILLKQSIKILDTTAKNSKIAAKNMQTMTKISKVV